MTTAMFRVRRYRVLLVFAAVFVLAFLHFARSRNWSDSASVQPAGIHPHPAKPEPPAAAEDSNKYVPPAPKPDSAAGSSSSSNEKLVAPGAAGDATKADNQLPGAATNMEPLVKPQSKDGKADSEKMAPNADKSSPSTSKTEIASWQNLPNTLGEEIDQGGSGRQETSRHDPEAPIAKWKKFPERFPVPAEQMIKLPKERPKTIPQLQAKFKDESTAEKQERLQQLSTIGDTFKHAWQGYKKVAMGHDEISPLTEGFRDPFNGWGATLVDALDSLWIMELRDEFAEAVDAVRTIDFTKSIREDIPVFETVIRYLGGLLGAYDVSGQRHHVLLEKAEELAQIIIGAFDTPNRMPVLYYRWAPDHVAKPHRASPRAVLAEIGSLSLEFTRLAQLTKEDKYYDAIARITNELEKLQDSTSIPGLWPLKVNAMGCARYTHQRRSTPTYEEPKPAGAESYKNIPVQANDIHEYTEPANYHHATSESGTDLTPAEKCDGGLDKPPSARDNKYGLGALADSTYEYLPKEFLLLGGVNTQYEKMYKKAMDATRKHLIFRPMVKGDRDLRFISSTTSMNPTVEGLRSSELEYEGSHLGCYAGGMFAVGAKAFGIDGDLDLAAKLTDGCVWAYESTRTGIMPENFRLFPCEKNKPCTWDESRYQANSRSGSSRDSNAQAHDSNAQAHFRSGESAYGERVKMNKDSEPQAPNAGGMSVPLPMPGSQTSHDNDQPFKRHVAAGGSAANSTVIPSPPVHPGALEIEHIENRDTSQYPPLMSPARVDEDRLPPGMLSIVSASYSLRPEAAESVFIMYRLTGDDYWRRKGWKMFEAIAKHTRTAVANAAITDVTASQPVQKDVMESFWLAETLKYFYLLFSDPSVVDLDKFVLNTEAHPFQRPT